MEWRKYKKQKVNWPFQKGIVLKIWKKQKMNIYTVSSMIQDSTSFLIYTVPSNMYQQDIFLKNVFLVLCIFFVWSAR